MPASNAATAYTMSNNHDDNEMLTVDTTMPGFRPARARRGSSLVIRNVIVENRRTSIRLEPEMWRSLQDICKRERCSVHDIATMVAAERCNGSLTAALRVFVMAYFRAAATEDGHNNAGHGSGKVLTPLFTMLAQKSLAERQKQQQREQTRV